MSKPGPAPKVTTEDVLGVFVDRDDPLEPLTAPEIADGLGCSRRTARKRLTALEEDGRVTSKKVGARAVVWWAADAAKERDVLSGYGSWTGTGLSEAVEETHQQLDDDLRERDRVLSGQ
ncbi:helix-turn-helix domain-containing protein [Natronorarus salvus]|uniref:helix-turn-helix domain-containing protein n=1 Tax=Natronorarus salvus TaxID=3117733 RepID=UPI002F263FB5